MNTRLRRIVILHLGLILSIPLGTARGQIRTYDVKFAAVGPTIDGTIAAGEWDAAASGGGDWTLLRTPNGGDLDAENNRFRALWNQDGFYLLAESDYDSWGEDISGQNPAASDFEGDFLSVFFDPNTLGEDNAGQLDEEVDNYQFSFNLYADARTCGGDGMAGTADDCTQPTDPPLEANATSVTGSTFGTLTAAHVDGLFNNNGEWEHLRTTHISYRIDDNGAVIEMFVPWGEFDALEVTNDTGAETGLHHPLAPNVNDVWFFNIARQSTDPDNFLPQWNWTSSQFFAGHGDEGHGEITFVGDTIQLQAGDADVDLDFDQLNRQTISFSRLLAEPRSTWESGFIESPPSACHGLVANIRLA